MLLSHKSYNPQYWRLLAYACGHYRASLWFSDARWSAGLAELSLETSFPFDVSIDGMQEVGHDADMAAHQCSAMQQAGNQAPRAMLRKGSHNLPWLLPFTDMFSKRRQFAVDGLGRVHLIVGKLWLQFYNAMHAKQH